jgi:hypothetical protein
LTRHPNVKYLDGVTELSWLDEEPEDIHGMLDEARANDPASGLEAIGFLKVWLELRESKLVEVARGQDRSWGWIAARLGRARQGVWEKHRDADDGDLPSIGSEEPSRRDRLLLLGERVEAVLAIIDLVERSSPDQSEWRSTTALLRQALAGFGKDELPSCHQLAREGPRRVDEKSTAGRARREISEALAALEA